MFKFPDMGDNDSIINKNKPKKTQNFRMNLLKHNPYVGSFHTKNINQHNNIINNDDLFLKSHSSIIEEIFKSNPLIGNFRHSPPQKDIVKHSLGLKTILYEIPHDNTNALSQLHINHRSNQLNSTSIKFLQSFRSIPSKVYSSSTLHSLSAVSSLNYISNQHETNQSSDIDVESNMTSIDNYNEAPPICSICIEEYMDGDEIRSLACSHCFHNECFSKWIYHNCLTMDLMNSICCPECRQNHIVLLHDNVTDTYSTTSSLSNNLQHSKRSHSQNIIIVEGISNQSFLQIGQQLAIDGGYDFLSDFSSELNSPQYTILINNNNITTDNNNNIEVVDPIKHDNSIISNDITIHKNSNIDANNSNKNKNIADKFLEGVTNEAIASTTTVPAVPTIIDNSISNNNISECHYINMSMYSDCGFPLPTNTSPTL